MNFPNKIIWSPDERTVADAVVTELGHRLKTRSYDELYKLSIEHAEDYWKEVIDHLQFEWTTPYKQFCDTARGPAHPAWFSTGRLNWVRNVLKWADDSSRRDRVAVVAEQESGATEQVTYSELAQRVLRFASGLKDQGVVRGDRIGLMMPMGIPAVVSFLAIAATGAICVPLFTGFGSEAIAARLSLSEARWLVTADGSTRRGKDIQSLGVLREVQLQLPTLRVILYSRSMVGEVVRPGSVVPWHVVAQASALAELETMEANDPFMIVFTSGTTGRPKGTVHTHAGFPLKILHDSAYHFNLRQADVWFWPSDLGWIVGPITVIGGLSRGATLVCYDGAPDFPSYSRIAAIIDRHRVTHFGASPTLIRSLAAAASANISPELSTLKLLIVAGEVIDPEHFEWFFRYFGRNTLPVINYTGGTEASGGILASVPVRPIKVSGFNGASPGVAAYAADPYGARVKLEIGELTIAQPFVGMTRSFWNDDARYFESYWTAVPGLWTHGDLVYEDSEGHFFILGRSDDTLKIAGKRVGPAEVESVVLELAEIREAVAVGLPDAKKGQQLVICVTLSPAASSRTDVAALVTRQVAAGLGKPFSPAAVHCVADLPKTRNGKAMRRVIRQLLCGLDPGDLSALENPTAVAIVKSLYLKANEGMRLPLSSG